MLYYFVFGYIKYTKKKHSHKIAWIALQGPNSSKDEGQGDCVLFDLSEMKIDRKNRK